MSVMDEACVRLCQEISGAEFGYVQSDEISIVFSDLRGANTQMWFNGKLQKVLSISASLVSGVLITRLGCDTDNIPMFDARIIAVEDTEVVDRYLAWRSKDAYKNAITMAAQTMTSHRELSGMNTRARVELLSGTDYDEAKLPEGFKRGRSVRQVEQAGTVEYVDKRSGELNITDVVRRVWTVEPYRGVPFQA